MTNLEAQFLEQNFKNGFIILYVRNGDLKLKFEIPKENKSMIELSEKIHATIEKHFLDALTKN